MVVVGEEVLLLVVFCDMYGNVIVFFKSAAIIAIATGGGVLIFFEECIGICMEVFLFLIFRLVGLYLFIVKIGDKVLDGYLRIFTVVSAVIEFRKCMLFGDAF